MKNIVVFFGGRSSEHDISIITGIQTINALDKNLYNVFPIYISKNGKWFYSEEFVDTKIFIDFDARKYKQVFIVEGENKLFDFKKKFKSNKSKQICKIDCAILCNHGMNGEDGSIQGLLELCHIPYTSSGIFGSAVSMDKVFMKQLFSFNELPITNYVWFSKNDYKKNQNKILSKLKSQIDFPMIVKPANLGSSIGITICNNIDELKNAIEVAQNFDSKIIVENVVPNLLEINCAVLGNKDDVELSKLETPLSWQSFLSFDDKYLNFSKANLKSAKLEKETTQKIKRMAKTAFQSLDLSGVVRIDFLLNMQTEEVFINEVNNIPGALSYYLFPKYTHSEFLTKLIDLAFEKYIEKESKTYSFKSDVLSQKQVVFAKK